MYYNQHQMNDWIIDKLKSNQPFSCVRLGNSEYNLIENIMNGRCIPDQWINFTHAIGIFPHTNEFCRDTYYPKIGESLQNADAIGHPGVSSKSFFEKFEQLYLVNKVCYTECRFLDPIYLLNYSDPWTKYLKGKKVLVINSSASSIEKQWDNIDNIWGDKRELICPFELVDVIRSPFAPSVCGGDIFYGNKKINDFIECSDMICDFIDDADFDIALIGAGAFAPVLASHIKSKKKSVITTCGATQLFFGVKGKRWTKSLGEHRKIINDDWIFPVEEDIPTNVKFIESFEGGNLYW